MPQEERNPAYWEAAGGGGVLGAVLIRDYAGDHANNRVIDLGDDYDRVEIHLRSAKDLNTSHLALALAILTTYEVSVEDAVTRAVEHRTMSFANPYWQGKMTGVDANKIKLAADTTKAGGTNKAGFDYTIIAYKYSTVLP